MHVGYLMYGRSTEFQVFHACAVGRTAHYGVSGTQPAAAVVCSESSHSDRVLGGFHYVFGAG